MAKRKAVSFTAFVLTVLGVVLTLGQRTLARVLFDGAQPSELTAEERDVAVRLLGSLQPIPPGARSVVALVCGRGSGKSRIFAAARLLHLGLTIPLGGLASGEVAFGVCCAPSLKLARQTLRFVRAFVDHSPALSALVVSVTIDAVTLRRADGHVITFETSAASARGAETRGRSIFAAVLDECAFFRDELTGAINDSDVYKSIVPRLLPGGQVVLASSPWAREGLLWSFFEANHGHATTAIAASAPTLEMRDDEHTRAMVAREYARDPDAARVELGAEFLDGGTSSLFDPNAIDACVTKRSMGTDAPEGAIVYAAGDLALSNDASALCIACELDSRVTILDLLEIRPRGRALKLSEVIKSFAERMKRYGVKSLMVDSWSREAAREHAEANGIELDDAPEGRTGKIETHLAARAIVHEGHVDLGDNAVLRSQLRAITSKPVAGGSMVISSPRRAGAHGDVASAAILAMWCAQENANARPDITPPAPPPARSFEDTPIGEMGSSDFNPLGF